MYLLLDSMRFISILAIVCIVLVIILIVNIVIRLSVKIVDDIKLGVEGRNNPF